MNPHPPPISKPRLWGLKEQTFDNDGDLGLFFFTRISFVIIR